MRRQQYFWRVKRPQMKPNPKDNENNTEEQTHSRCFEKKKHSQCTDQCFKKTPLSKLLNTKCKNINSIPYPFIAGSQYCVKRANRNKTGRDTNKRVCRYAYTSVHKISLPACTMGAFLQAMLLFMQICREPSP